MTTTNTDALVPSCARTSVLAVQTRPVNIVQMAPKASADCLDYSLDFTDVLKCTGDAPAAVNSAVVLTAQQETYDLVVMQSSVSGQLATLILASGQPGTFQRVQVEVATTQGRILSVVMQVQITDLTEATLPPSSFPADVTTNGKVLIAGETALPTGYTSNGRVVMLTADQAPVGTPNFESVTASSYAGDGSGLNVTVSTETQTIAEWIAALQKTAGQAGVGIAKIEASQGAVTTGEPSTVTLTATLTDGTTSVTTFTAPAGATGATGAQGVQGAQGIQGQTGAQGEQGLRGPQGDTGAQGPQGIQGASGVSLTNKGAWVSGTTYTKDDFVFAPSSQYPSVNSLYVVTTQGSYVSTIAPASDTENWSELQAPQGPQGATGATGATGVQGPKGDTGAQGPQGNQGIQGEAGSDADVTSANIATALGYTPANGADYFPLSIDNTKDSSGNYNLPALSPKQASDDNSGGLYTLNSDGSPVIQIGLYDGYYGTNFYILRSMNGNPVGILLSNQNGTTGSMNVYNNPDGSDSIGGNCFAVNGSSGNSGAGSFVFSNSGAVSERHWKIQGYTNTSGNYYPDLGIYGGTSDRSAWQATPVVAFNGEDNRATFAVEPLVLQTFTFATLPTSPVDWQRAVVTDKAIGSGSTGVVAMWNPVTKAWTGLSGEALT